MPPQPQTTAGTQLVTAGISPKDVFRFLRRQTFDTPVGLYKAVMVKVDALACSRDMMSGRNAVLTMPMAIMMRNAARTAYSAVTPRKALNYVSTASGVLSAGAAFWLASNAVFSGIAASPALAAVPVAVKTIAALGAAGCAVPVVVPAFTLGMVVAATFLAATAFALSTMPAMMNLPVAWNRTMDAMRGISLNYNDPPALASMQAPAAEEQPAAAPPPPPPEINTDEATTLNDHLTFKKVKISFRKAGGQTPAVTEFRPGLRRGKNSVPTP